MRELWIESVLKAENTSNLVSNKQKDRVGKMGQSYTSSKQKFFFYNKNTPGNNIIKDVSTGTLKGLEITITLEFCYSLTILTQ